MISIDLNCDMGESLPGKPIGNDAGIMPFISSANIACGYHGGGGEIMRDTILLAMKYGVAIGAHPSFDDIEGFGRREFELSAEEIYALVFKQIQAIKTVTEDCGGSLHHVKPHGALYNMAAKRSDYAEAIAKAIVDVDASLILYGLAGSLMISKASDMGLQTCSEVFADRRYLSDGSLTPRSISGAVIEDKAEAVQQVLTMVKDAKVQSISGDWVNIKAETICIHGDHAGADVFAKALSEQLYAEGITIKSC